MLSCHFGFAQLPNEQNNKVINFMTNQINSHSFKDSTAVYTFNLRILIDRKSRIKPKITPSDSTFLKHFNSIDSLSKFNFRGIMPNKQTIQFILPIVIIVMGSENDKNRIYPRIMADKIATLYRYGKEFDYSLESRILFPLILAYDKKVYD